MKVLLICDDFHHPGDIPIRGIEPLKEKGFEFDVLQDPRGFDFNTLKDYPVVILSKSDYVAFQLDIPWKSDDDVQTAFIDYVENGGGLLVSHSGTVAGKHKPTKRLDALVGCRFTRHPNQCPVTVAPIKPHPITKGVDMFCEIDEHYFIDILDPDVNVFAAAYAPPQGEESKYETEWYFNNPGGIVTAGYTRTQGKGRVCVLPPGHTVEVWLNGEFQKMLANGLMWCAGEL
ncbi:MAG: ThuA domain-containing protein [Defluviitaleaceae bacterium]|nr:ThuA domain-containing protein [Defluviitaleaceae bacterium]